jgi:hypothetical protein
MHWEGKSHYASLDEALQDLNDGLISRSHARAIRSNLRTTGRSDQLRQCRQQAIGPLAKPAQPLIDSQGTAQTKFDRLF